MSEIEDKLSSLLSNPAALGKVLSAIQSISSAGGEKPAEPAQAGAAADAVAPAFGHENTDKSPFPGLDPKTAALALKLLGAYSSQDNRQLALLNALKPYVSRERCEYIDRAQSMIRIAKVARQALDGLIGGAPDV
jgi:hypothetical protein